MVIYRELSSLEQDLAFDAQTLYAVSNNLSRHYRTVRIPKKDGGERRLSVPDGLLRSIQRSIAEKLLAYMPVSRHATAYRFGGSVLRNAMPHRQKPLVLTLDIYHFFDHIRYSTVKDKAFPSEIYAEPLRILLAMLCYHRDVLPQGAPTSPAITNIVMKEFDDSVGRWCAERGIAYTRYCDDMTFSGSFDAAEVIRFVRTQLAPMGLLLNEQKTRLQKAGTRQAVTGIVVNEKLNVPAAYRRRLRQELYYCRKFGIAGHIRNTGMDCSEEVCAMRLLGRVSFCLQASPTDSALLDHKRWLLSELKRLQQPQTLSL